VGSKLKKGMPHDKGLDEKQDWQEGQVGMKRGLMGQDGAVACSLCGATSPKGQDCQNCGKKAPKHSLAAASSKRTVGRNPSGETPGSSGTAVRQFVSKLKRKEIEAADPGAKASPTSPNATRTPHEHHLNTSFPEP